MPAPKVPMPKKPKEISLRLRMAPALHERLRQMAEQRDISLNQLIVKAASAALDGGFVAASQAWGPPPAPGVEPAPEDSEDSDIEEVEEVDEVDDTDDLEDVEEVDEGADEEPDASAPAESGEPGEGLRPLPPVTPSG